MLYGFWTKTTSTLFENSFRYKKNSITYQKQVPLCLYSLQLPLTTFQFMLHLQQCIEQRWSQSHSQDTHTHTFFVLWV